MQSEEFGSIISEICSHSPLAEGRPLFWTIIVNPKAGGFTIKSRWKKHYAMLQRSLERAKLNPLRESYSPSAAALKEGENTGRFGLVPTRKMGHAAELVSSLLEEAGTAAMAHNGKRPFFLVITAGGDGTSLEVLNGLFHAPAPLLEDFAVLRLPMGTGNDGADSWYLDKALELLTEPAIIQKQRAIRLKTAGRKGSFMAYNILSVGVDAFVTHWTNKMKGKMPGDSYKLWVDIAALFYDKIYKVDYMDVRSEDGEGKEVKSFREKLLLLAVGESGRRTYGSHKHILPDDRNICVLKQMSLLRKLSLKELLAKGTHINTPEAILWNGLKVEFISPNPILAQMDGETVLLEKADFPACIELTEPVIPILKPAGV